MSRRPVPFSNGSGQGSAVELQRAQAVLAAARKPLDMASVYGRIRQAILVDGSQKAFAARVGVSEAFLSAVLNGRKAPSDVILSASGVNRVVHYYEVPPHG